MSQRNLGGRNEKKISIEANKIREEKKEKRE